MPKQSKTAVIEAAGAEFSLAASLRDSGIFLGSEVFLKEGGHFLTALGVYQNYTVAGGLPVGSKALVKRNVLSHRAESLLFKLRRDNDLLSFDYSYSFVSQGKRRNRGGTSGFKVHGLFGLIDARPRGYCELRLSEVSPIGVGRDVEIIDVRNRTEIQTDEAGVIRIHKQRAEFDLPDRISKLVDFLKENRCDQVMIRFV